MKPPDLTGSGGASANSISSANGRTKKQNTTGRQTVVFRKDALGECIKFLSNAGFKVFVSNVSNPTVLREDQVGDADVIVYPSLGVATVGGTPEQMSQLENAASDSNNPIEKVVPEKVRHALEYQPTSGTGQVAPPPRINLSLEYLKGCRDSFTNLIAQAESNGESTSLSPVSTGVAGFDESQVTWGLQATKVVNSPFSGRKIKVAVLDTGIDFTLDEAGNAQFHSDFAGRTIVTASFVPNVTTAKDGNGHGTHCIGTACGPRQPPTLPGYGVAFNSEIYAGKVLNDAGLGADGWIIAGIEWAINQGCRIVSLSLGSSKSPGDTFDEEYEEIAQRAFEAGTVIVAAAGNDSSRPTKVEPVNGPADCPSIVAVAAIDPALQIARFSNAGINSSGGEINVAAPGVDIFSSFLRPPGHKRLPGTSMATPHVAGIAALFAEANPSLTGRQLRDLVIGSAKPLTPFGTQDVGSGLVQAPQNGQPLSVTPTRPVDGAELELPRGGIVQIQQTSPITIGGGGSVGLDFDTSHYKEIGSGVFASAQDKLTTCHVLHQNGKLLRNFFPEIDGNQCVITVTCIETDMTTTQIRIAGGPSGQLAVAFNEAHFPPGAATQPTRFSATRKVVSVAVTNVLTGQTSTFEVPAGWAGNIVIDN